MEAFVGLPLFAFTLDPMLHKNQIDFQFIRMAYESTITIEIKMESSHR